MIKVGINGFGRIGRTIFRAYLQKLDQAKVEIVAINNIGEVAKLVHLLKYDSVHGVLPYQVKAVSSSGQEALEVTVGSRVITIPFYSEKDPAQIPWEAQGVQVVMDCTGRFKDKEGLGKHLRGTVKKVIMSAPGSNLDGTFVVGVNLDSYDESKHHIVSNASCTTNCLAPIVKVLHENFGIEHGLVNTTHSYTADQRLIDAEHDDLRRARSAALSIIPTTTGAAKAIGEVIPSLKGKLDGLSMRVPTANVSVCDLTATLKTKATVEEVNKALEEVSGDLAMVLKVSHEELVSVDFNGNPASSTVDAKFTMVKDSMVKVISWYDNETGYSHRMLDLAERLISK